MSLQGAERLAEELGGGGRALSGCPRWALRDTHCPWDPTFCTWDPTHCAWDPTLCPWDPTHAQEVNGEGRPAI